MERTEESHDDQIIKYLVEKMGQPGFTPEDYAFLTQHLEYQHRPVGIKEFITSPNYLDSSEDCWPSVMMDLEEIFPDRLIYTPKMSDYMEIIRKMGYGSGNGFRIRYAFAYVIYRLACFRDPQKAYGRAAGSTIALVNAAITANHAKKIIFGDISECVARSPWFQAHLKPDPDVQSELRFPKNLVIFPGSSSEVAPVGYNIFFLNMDEAAFFIDTDARDAAREIYGTGRRRIKSRFGEYGLSSAISSPSHVDNFIEQKCEEAKTDPKISAKEGPTWENKPEDIAAVARGEFFELAHPRTRETVKIPNLYKDDFKKDPKKAWRDFGAVASLAIDPYMSDDEIGRLEQLMSYGRDVRVWSQANLLRGAIYHAHIDLGLKRDACGIAVGRDEHEKVYIELILRIVCRRRADELDRKMERYDMIIGEEQVDFEKVRQIILDMQEQGFTFGMVSFDQFQSVDSRQQLEKRGIPTSLVSVDRDTSAYDTVKSLINTERLEIVKHEHALKEAKSLELKKGKKVDHAPGASKDLMDAVAGVCKTLMERYDEDDEVDETFVEDEGVQVTGEI